MPMSRSHKERQLFSAFDIQQEGKGFNVCFIVFEIHGRL